MCLLMRLIDRGAIYQPQLPTLELREPEITNMYQSKLRRSCPSIAYLVRKPFKSKIPNLKLFAQLKRPVT